MDIMEIAAKLLGNLKPTMIREEDDLSSGDLLIQHKDYKGSRLPVRRYDIKDLQSLVSYCKSYVDQDDGAVFYTTKSIVVLPNEARPFSNRMEYYFNRSRRLKAWLSIGRVNQKEFRDFLEVRLGEIANPSLYEELAKLKLNATISYNSDMDDNNNYMVAFETKQAKGSSSIPKRITVNVPFFEGEEELSEFQFRLQFGQPKEESQKPLFWLEPIGLEELEARHVEGTIRKLKKDLPGYEVFHGDPGYAQAGV